MKKDPQDATSQTFEYLLRPAVRQDIDAIHDVERKAACRFDAFPDLNLGDDVTSAKILRRAIDDHRMWVAEGTCHSEASDEAPVDSPQVIGFAYGTVVDTRFHLAEVDVLPTWGRRGVGTVLIRRVIDQAQRWDFPGVTLTTFREVPWNAPFYRRLGFVDLPESDWTPGLVELVAAEKEEGLDFSRRTVMLLQL